MRLDALMATTKAGAGSSGSCMSVVEILVSLYYGELLGKKVFNCDPERPGFEERDQLILS